MFQTPPVRQPSTSRSAKMENDQNEIVDLYVPRKCSSSSRIISAKDHGAIQIDFVDVDPATGRLIPGKVTRYAICGALRAMGESDDCLLRLAQRDGIIPQNI
ncbi:40S ribosomal protein S21 [Aphelenchoides fujianensis]|nr:40S ribosomal protein S21 [Aphelenchoides fujianensis]